jgi:hypothetical protein
MRLTPNEGVDDVTAETVARVSARDDLFIKSLFIARALG